MHLETFWDISLYAFLNVLKYSELHQTARGIHEAKKKELNSCHLSPKQKIKLPKKEKVTKHYKEMYWSTWQSFFLLWRLRGITVVETTLTKQSRSWNGSKQGADLVLNSVMAGAPGPVCSFGGTLVPPGSLKWWLTVGDWGAPLPSPPGVLGNLNSMLTVLGVQRMGRQDL